MQTVSAITSRSGLEDQGIHNVDVIHWNLSTPHLYEEARRRNEGRIARDGQLVVRTGRTSLSRRSPTSASPCRRRALMCRRRF